MGSVDLHVHSRHSDGTLTPREIADRALARGVTLLAIADHDVCAGSLELAPLCAERGISYVPAVEHSTLHSGQCFHVLGYFADLTDPDYRALIARARLAMDGMSVELIVRMATDEPRVSADDFMRFERDPSLGGWAGIEYLMRRGVTESLRAGMRYYAQYGVLYEHATFPSLAETIAAIHAAGGRAVLAHPGEVIHAAGHDGFSESDPAGFLRTLEELLAQGLDGIECYYPLHSEWMTNACLGVCRRLGLMITAGSDCHGAFGNADVGEMEIDASMIRL